MQMHTIGFVEGNPTELQAFATAGAGIFYNALNQIDLQNACASIANQIVIEKVAARKLMVQEVLKHPPLDYMDGTQKTTIASTVQAERFETLQDANGNTVLRWYFGPIAYWGVAEVSYKAVAATGSSAIIGLDSVHAQGGFWSQLVYTDGSGNSQDGHDGGGPAGLHTAQVIDDRNGHS